MSAETKTWVLINAGVVQNHVVASEAVVLAGLWGQPTAFGIKQWKTPLYDLIEIVSPDLVVNIGDPWPCTKG
jgi:hypothetical protein